MAAKKTNKKTKKRRITIRKVINSIKKGGYPSSDTSSNRDYMNMSDYDFTPQDVNEEFLIDEFVRLSGKSKGEIIKYSKVVNEQIKEDFKNFLTDDTDTLKEIEDLIPANSMIDFIADVAKLPDE